MRFQFEALDLGGKKVLGTIEAGSESDVVNQLRQRGLRPVRVQKESFGGGLRALGSTPLSLELFGSARPKTKELTTFMRQLSAMISSGVPIVQTLSVLAHEVPNKQFAQVLTKVRDSIEGGSSFSAALQSHHLVFDPIFINLVAAGESSGAIDQILNRVADYYEKTLILKRKVIGAMSYPAIVLSVAFMVTYGMLIMVVPNFVKTFQSGKALPPLTQYLMKTSEFVLQYQFFILAAVVTIVAGVVMALKNANFRSELDPILLRVPVFGEIIRKTAVARFTRTFGVLLQAGVPIMDALMMSSRVIGNRVVENVIAKTQKSIMEGQSISGPLARSGQFPPMAVSMISVGEQTGQLDKMLDKTADFYEGEVDASITTLSSIMEPVLIIFVGGIVLVIVLAMYMPLFDRISELN